MIVWRLQLQRSQGETEQRQLHDDLDSCKARIVQLEKQIAMKQETITIMQNSAQTYESKIRTLEQEGGEKSGQLEVCRRQHHRLVSDLDEANTMNAALRQENE